MSDNNTLHNPKLAHLSDDQLAQAAVKHNGTQNERCAGYNPYAEELEMRNSEENYCSAEIKNNRNWTADETAANLAAWTQRYNEIKEPGQDFDAAEKTAKELGFLFSVLRDKSAKLLGEWVEA